MKCPACGYNNAEGAPYCNLCQTSFVKNNEPGPVPPPPPEGAPPAGLKRDYEELNWLRRHLNWTWVLAQIAVFLISVAGVVVLAVVLVKTPDLNTGYLFTGTSMFFNVVWILTIVAAFGVGALVLKEKDRSLAWLLILLLPLGWFFFLLLDNRKDMPSLSVLSPARFH